MLRELPDVVEDGLGPGEPERRPSDAPFLDDVPRRRCDPRCAPIRWLLSELWPKSVHVHLLVLVGAHGPTGTIAAEGCPQGAALWHLPGVRCYPEPGSGWVISGQRAMIRDPIGESIHGKGLRDGSDRSPASVASRLGGGYLHHHTCLC